MGSAVATTANPANDSQLAAGKAQTPRRLRQENQCRRGQRGEHLLAERDCHRVGWPGPAQVNGSQGIGQCGAQHGTAAYGTGPSSQDGLRPNQQKHPGKAQGQPCHALAHQTLFWQRKVGKEGDEQGRGRLDQRGRGAGDLVKRHCGQHVWHKAVQDAQHSHVPYGCPVERKRTPGGDCG